ncbi:membrane domain protein, partial [Yersinia pestis PY-48]
MLLKPAILIKTDMLIK